MQIIHKSSKKLLLVLLLATAVVAGCLTPADVLTYHNDNARTGLNAKESGLTWASFASPGFHKRFEQSVDGCVFAQPLYAAKLQMHGDGATHDVVFVATEHGTVYAFDADNNTGINSTPIWQASLLMGGSPVLPSDVGVSGETNSCPNITPEICITGTPVIDRANRILYVVAKTREVKSTSAGGQVVDFVQRLHVLNLGSGLEAAGGPMEIARTTYNVPFNVPVTTPPVTGPAAEPGQYVSGIKLAGGGEGQDPSDGKIFFNALRENQRAGLTLVNGIVYVAWTSHCDCTPSHGWVMGFYAYNLMPVAGFLTTPNASSGGWPNPLAIGGVWQAGAAPAADNQGAIYLATGNGVFDGISAAGGLPTSGDYGNSVLKLGANPTLITDAVPGLNGWGLQVADYFTPHDQDILENSDNDLGSGGVVVLPDQSGPNPHLAVQAGKNGTIYLLNRDPGKLGEYSAAADNIVQSLPVSFGTQQNVRFPLQTNYGIAGIPAYFNQAVYFIGQHANVMRFPVVNGQLQTPPLTVPATPSFNSGAIPSISANGTANGIVWVVQSDGYYGHSHATLHAFRADDLTKLYSSEDAPGATDRPTGYAIEYSVPTIANGRVYVGTSSKLAVYGPP